MTREEETMDARSAMNHAQIAVKRELDGLHMDKRDRDEVIASQQKQIKMMREESELAKQQACDATESKKHALKSAEFSIFVGYAALIVSGTLFVHSLAVLLR